MKGVDVDSRLVSVTVLPDSSGDIPTPTAAHSAHSNDGLHAALWIVQPLLNGVVVKGAPKARCIRFLVVVVPSILWHE